MVNSELLSKNLTSSSGSGNVTFNNDGNKEKSADENALKNASGAANNSKETADLVLRGYPLLKAKTTLEITGVGKGSGVWYCKTVVQQWHVDHGYLTNVKLMKQGGDDSSGSDGGGDSGVTPPSAPIK